MISRIELKPTDVMIISIDHRNAPSHIREKYAETTRGAFVNRFPHHQVMIIDNSIDVNVVGNGG